MKLQTASKKIKILQLEEKGSFQRGSEEGVPENLRVPLEGDRDFGELCGKLPGVRLA